jgi:phage tail-like protein
MAVAERLPAFYRLDPSIGWRLAATAEPVQIDPRTGALQLGYVGRQPSPLVDPSGAFGGLTLPTGIAVTDMGEVLVASPDGRVILHAPNPRLFHIDDPAVPGFAPLWHAPTDLGASPADAAPCAIPIDTAPFGPYDLVRPIGLAFSRDGDLILTDAGGAAHPARLIVYTWPSMAVRHVAAIGGEPWDVAVDDAGQIYVADAAAGRVRRFDRLWRESEWPGGAGTLHRPRHLVVQAGGTVFVVDEDPATGAGRLSQLTPLGAAVPLDGAGIAAFWQGSYPPPIRLDGDGAHVPGRPCTDDGPSLSHVLVDRRGRLPQGPVLLYREQQGRRARRGRYVTMALDSGQFNFAWHLLNIEIQSFTAATPLEAQRIASLPEASWSRRTVLTNANRPEALLQSQPGRYLWLRLGLVGDGVSTPKLHAIDILGPRRSSLRFLPAPFHEDPVARDFLDRFLSYFDAIFAEIEHDIDRFAAQLGARGAPEGPFLAWLAGWFDIAFLARWPEATRRAFVSQAMELHRTRGTIAGLTAVIRLHLGLAAPMPVLIEGFRARDYAMRLSTATGEDLPDGLLRIGGTALPDPWVMGDVAHRFLLVVPANSVPTQEDRAMLNDLVDAFRPAHTAWDLATFAPGLRVGCQAMIGVDALVGTYPSEPLGDMRLGQSALLRAPTNNLPRIGQAVVRDSAAM